MLKLKDFELFKSLLKDTSKDEENKEYMTDNLYEVCNFDAFVCEYFDSNLSSNDALLFTENKNYFIEFKNGKISSDERKELRKKIYESIIVLLEKTPEEFSTIQNSYVYILVYNEMKNSLPDKLKKENLEKIHGKITEKAKKYGLVHFELSYLENRIFSEVYTFNETEFKEFLDELNLNL